MILALAGGVGGAKLANGLAATLPPDDLVVVVNTGDDFEHLGLHIAPDLDTVMYTLSGRANREQGWGLANETWSFMDALAALGGETWFRLGDRDLATHVERTRMLRAGDALSEVTRHLCQRFGIAHPVVPMSDDPVRTIVETAEGTLEFQRYFVGRHCEPVVTDLRYRGAASARPSPAFEQALGSDALRAIVICPSNPMLSIAPILAVNGVRERIAASGVPVVAVSPIIAGRAVKGPAAKIMRELGHDVSPLGVAKFYAPLVTRMVIDRQDEALAPALRATGVDVLTVDTLMKDPTDQARLARAVLAFAHGIAS
jgi:LPPG:FO 2-phospho-L-lactate transferase